jgi:berberine-like enzyme
METKAAPECRTCSIGATRAGRRLASRIGRDSLVYVNFLNSDDDASRVREAYGDDTYARLAVIKAKYDPENVFHNNKNIEPGQPAT